jgi:prevent-host-death family protein
LHLWLGDYKLVTMAVVARKIPAGEFKAKCLRLIDEVGVKGELVITKRGRAVAKLVPFEANEEAPLAGLIAYEGDIVSPVGDPWDADS